MRLIPKWLFPCLCGLAMAVGAQRARAEPGPQEAEEDSQDVLGELVVEAGGNKKGPIRLPKVALSLQDANRESAMVAEVLRTDLRLSAELEPIDAKGVAAGAEFSAWKDAGAQVVVRVKTERLTMGLVRMIATLEAGPTSRTYEISLQAPQSSVRLASHQLADEIISAYTGVRSAFFAQLAFVRSRQGKRTIQVLEPDGHNLRQVTIDSAVALAPAFGPDHVLYFAASFGHGSYRLYRAGEVEPIPIDPPGSIYGIAFSKDYARVALSIAVGGQILVFTGNGDFTGLAPETKVDLALHPVFSPSGKVAYAGTKGNNQRVYVGERAVSPVGAPASSPTFCDHPEGVRLVYAVGSRDRSDLIAGDLYGRNNVRLTDGKGRDSSPTCSPDGRLVAFFSTRRSGEGPGLYIGRVDGRRPPQRIASVTGDSLVWGRLPKPFPVVINRKAPKAEAHSDATP